MGQPPLHQWYPPKQPQQQPPQAPVPQDAKQLVGACCKVAAHGGSGSGVCFYRDDAEALVLTNYHVIVDSLRFKAPPKAIFPGGLTLTAQIVAASKEKDLAALRVTNPPASLPWAPIAEKYPAKGMPLYQVGYPRGVGPVFRKGVIEGYNVAKESGHKRELMVNFNPPIIGGDSGSPVFFAEEGTIAGLIWGGPPGENSPQAVAVPLENIRPFVEQYCLGKGLFKPKPQQPPVAPPAPQPQAPPNYGADLKDQLAKLEGGLAGLQKQMDGIKGGLAEPPAAKPLPLAPPEKTGQVPPPQAQAAPSPAQAGGGDLVGTLLPWVLGAVGLGGLTIPAAFAWRIARGAVVRRREQRQTQPPVQAPAPAPYYTPPYLPPYTPPGTTGTVIVGGAPEVFTQHQPVGVPVNSDVAEACAWAAKKQMEDYPGMTGAVQMHQSLMKQFLSGKGKLNA